MGLVFSPSILHRFLGKVHFTIFETSFAPQQIACLKSEVFLVYLFSWYPLFTSMMPQKKKKKHYFSCFFEFFEHRFFSKILNFVSFFLTTFFVKKFAKNFLQELSVEKFLFFSQDLNFGKFACWRSTWGYLQKPIWRRELFFLTVFLETKFLSVWLF